MVERALKVMKFGGTSVADAICIRRLIEIVAQATSEASVVVVVSAMSGVTNRLLESARQAESGDINAGSDLARDLRDQHRTAIKLLVADQNRRAELTNEIEKLIDAAAALCHGTALLRELTPRALDAIASTGERLSARLVAASLNQVGLPAVAVEATKLMVTTDTHGQAEPLMDETRERVSAHLRPLLADGIVPVVTGFIGATIDGTLTTLGRGGSDYSATILGAALGAAETIIWTDVDGVLTADPRLVSDARTICEISYPEAAELAYFGARVLHPKTLRPVTEARIPVWIRNSFAPTKPGTKITSTGHATTSGVKAITAIEDVSMITVGGPGIVGVPDVVARTFAATAGVQANVLLISQASSQNDICFIVHTNDTDRALQRLRRVFSFADHPQVEHINVDSEIAIIAVVGERMRGVPGIAGRTFSALGRVGINVIAIAQGSSEYNISFVVAARELARAVAELHREFALSLHGVSAPALVASSGDRKNGLAKAYQEIAN